MTQNVKEVFQNGVPEHPSTRSSAFRYGKTIRNAGTVGTGNTESGPVPGTPEHLILTHGNQLLAPWLVIHGPWECWGWCGLRYAASGLPALLVCNQVWSARLITWMSKHGVKRSNNRKITTTCGHADCLNPEHLALEEPRKKLPAALRFRVLRRDDFRCRYCGAAPEQKHLHVDHVIPLSSGGPDEESNLVTACSDCNQGKGSDSVETRPDKPLPERPR